MRFCCLLILLFACGGPDEELGYDDAAHQIDGQAAEDAPGWDDTDDDGWPDNHDNCPTVTNPLQSNGDGDRWGDECDGCPLWITGEEDADRDGVFDLCDPYPSEPGDRVALVEWFRTIDSTRWRYVGGLWELALGGLLTTPSTIAPTSLVSEAEYESPTIELYASLGPTAAPSPGPDLRYAAVWTAAALDEAELITGSRCRLVREVDGGPARQQLEHIDQVGAKVAAERTGTVPMVPTWYRVRARGGTNETTCLFSDFGPRLEYAGAVPSERGRVAVSALGVTTLIRGLVIYERDAVPRTR